MDVTTWVLASGGAFVASTLLLVAVVAVVAARRRVRVTGPVPTVFAARRALEAALDVELDRARRLERPLTVLLVTPSPGGDPPRLDDPASRPALRRTDRAFACGSELYVLAPDTDGPATGPLRARLTAQLGGGAEIRSVSFPTDGLTVGALLTALTRPSAAPAIVRRTVLDPRGAIARRSRS